MKGYVVTLDPEEVDKLVKENLMEILVMEAEGHAVLDKPDLVESMNDVLEYYSTPQEFKLFKDYLKQFKSN